LPAREFAATASIWELETRQIRPAWLFAITISACAGQFMPPSQAQMEGGPQLVTSRGEHSDPTEPLPNCMARWYADSHITKQEWLQACEHAGLEDPNYNVDYARCLSDWDPETHISKREWHKSGADVVKEDPGAFEEKRRNQ
jgi:hypothetical protein